MSSRSTSDEKRNGRKNKRFKARSGEPEKKKNDAMKELASFLDMFGKNVEPVKIEGPIIDWTEGMSEEEIAEKRQEYGEIITQIKKVPKIADVMRLNIPRDEKVDLVDKVILLRFMNPFSLEYVQVLKYINGNIDRIRKNDITKEELERYEKLEQELAVDGKLPIKYQILDSGFSDKTKSFLLNKHKHLSSVEATHENGKLKIWFDHVLDIPSSNDIDFTPVDVGRRMYDLRRALDENVYGLEAVKEKIMAIYNNSLTNKNTKGKAFALVGPPGTCKTSIIGCLAKVLDIPVATIPLGGAKDASYIYGHNYTYEGSGPGAIVQALYRLGRNDGILYFDELDKISDTTQGNELSRALLHIADTSQNDKFHDRYISSNVDIDLSNLWFVYSLNDSSAVDSTLRDRIPIIEIPGYTVSEKLQIAKNHLIPRAMENMGMSPEQVIFPDEIIKYMIDLTGAEPSGVRQLKHVIDDILTKINMLCTLINSSTKFDISYNIPGFRVPHTLCASDIRRLRVSPAPKHCSIYI